MLSSSWSLPSPKNKWTYFYKPCKKEETPGQVRPSFASVRYNRLEDGFFP
jgi:hypothetical protein